MKKLVMFNYYKNLRNEMKELNSVQNLKILQIY